MSDFHKDMIDHRSYSHNLSSENFCLHIFLRSLNIWFFIYSFALYFQTFYNLHAKSVFVADSAKENVTQLSRLDVLSEDVY